MNIPIKDESKVWYLASYFREPIQFSEWVSEDGESEFLNLELIRSTASL